MLTAAYEKMGDHYGRWTAVHEVDPEILHQAIMIFENYKKRGIILNDCWDDTSWKLTNEVKNVGLTLVSFEGHYFKNARNWIGCDYRCYQDCIKAYIVFNLGEMELSTLRGIANAFTTLAKITSDEVLSMAKYINHIVELLQIIPGNTEERDWVIGELEEKLERSKSKKKDNKRRLADLQTYLKFNDIINGFWLTVNKEQKLFYFPLYFWWNLTAILPLRPTEFLLIPRNCLEIGNNGESILTIRRTKLKGGFEKIAYCIAEDYEYKKYVITDELANELRLYLNATIKMQRTSIDTLFLQEPHYKHFGISINPNSKYYSYANLNTCLRCFYQDVVGPINAKLNTVRLGDTRHIAMINLIISGGSPVICRELAGHSDINISSHYYSNISNLVECVTLERYRKLKGEKVNIVGKTKFQLVISKDWHRLPEGWCDVPAVKEGNINECLKIIDMQGEIGNCNYCAHYHPDEAGIRLEFLDENTSKQKVDADSRYLLQMIESVRKGVGYVEDIGAVLLRLQRSSNHYSKCLWKKYSGGSDISWQDQEK